MGGSAYWQLLVSGGKSGHQATATGTAPTTAMLAKSHIPPTDARVPRPGDATLSVTKAAHVLGVHPNTIRAWSEAGRLRYYRINDRGDRRYRLVDLQRFLTAAASDTPAAVADASTCHAHAATGHRADGPHAHRVRRRRRPAGGPRRDRLVPERAWTRRSTRRATASGVATGAALVGIWELPAGRPRLARDRRRGPRDHGRPQRSRPGRSLFSQAPRVAASRSTPAPAATGPPPVLGHGHRRARRAHPGRRAPVGRPRHRGRRASSAATTATGSPGAIARTLGVLDPGRQRDRAGERAACAAPRRCAASRPTSPRGSTWATSSATSATTPASCSAPTGSRWSCTTPRAASRSPGGTGFSDAFLDAARDLEIDRARPARAPVAPAGDPRRPRHAAIRQPDPRRRRPGGRRHAARARRSSTGTSSTGCSTSPTTARTAGARSTSTAPRPSPATRRSPCAPRGRSAGWPPGRRSSSRSSASASRLSGLTEVREIGHAIATELRQLIDYHNVRVYRVHGKRPRAGRDAGHGAVYSRRDRREPARSRSARASPAGSPSSASRSSSTTRPTTRARSRSRAPSPTSTSRCSSRRWSTRACASASRAVASSACASSPRTTCGCW